MTPQYALLALCGQLGLTAENLDDLVYDAATARAMPALNQEADGAKQETAIQDAEAKASRINNGGIGAQLAFLSAHFGHEETERLVRQVGKGN